MALLAGVAFGGSPYVAAHLLGHFDLLTAWVIPLFALCLRRSLRTGSIAAARRLRSVRRRGRVRLHREPRANTQPLFTARLVIMALMALDLFLIVVITVEATSSIAASRSLRKRPQSAVFVAARIRVAADEMAVGFAFNAPPESFWRGAQALMITVATFALVSLPLIAQAFRLALSGRYVSQTYFWRSAPRGVDALAPLAGNPFHPLYGAARERVLRTVSASIASKRWAGSASCPSWCC